MFTKLRVTTKKRWFDFLARDIFLTPPAKCNQHSSLIILSQIYPADMTMYMLAAKSFSRYIRPREFVIIDDGLSAHHRLTLTKHFDKIRFISIDTIASKFCPKGGTWERLLGIATLNSDDYVIQLDADTLTLANPDEVLSCVSGSRSFTLGTLMGQNIVGALAASEFARKHPSNHVQIQAELALERLPDSARLKYVRGCSGFTGFAPGTLNVEKVEHFSSAMMNLIGMQQWNQWGSEQVTSNFLVANCPNSLVLPVHFYPPWSPACNPTASKFIHFVGTHRFKNGQYSKMAKNIISQLK